MAIIGRKEEIRELERCERSKKSELICVYGRRRVGKMYLVEQTYADYFAFRATGVESGDTAIRINSHLYHLFWSSFVSGSHLRYLMRSMR